MIQKIKCYINMHGKKKNWQWLGSFRICNKCKKIIWKKKEYIELMTYKIKRSIKIYI